jgi:hypothetical protein
MFDQILNYENKFFINGQELLGTESITLGYSNSFQTKKFLGFNVGSSIVAGATTQQLSITRNLIYDDPVLNFTGESNISGSINYNNNNNGFRSGYLTDYLVSCAVGAIPKVTTNITIYDELVSGTKNASGSVAAPSIYIPNQGSISLSCDGSTTNRVVGFDYSIKSTRRPVYSIGSQLPTEVLLVGPLEYTAAVQIDVDDAFLQSGMSFLDSRENKTVSFIIKGRTGNNLQTLTIPKASLVTESLNSTSDGGVKLTLNYVGHS